MSRPATTLLTITFDFLARADVSAQGQVLKVWRQPRRSDSSLGDLVETAIKLAPGLGRNVWILCEDLWTQVLALPGNAVAGLNDDDLARAFSFESEPLSGITAVNAVLGFARAEQTDDLQAFRITATDLETRAQMQQAVRRHGGKLAGLVHPAGVAASLTEVPAGKQWRRVETWKQMTLCVTSDSVHPARIQILNATTAQPRVQASVSSFMSAVPENAEMLSSGGSAENAAASPKRVELSRNEDLQRWLQAWAHALSGQRRDIPVISPEPIHTPASTYLVAGAALLALSVLACIAHRQVTTSNLASVQDQIKTLQEPAAQMGEVRKNVKKIKTQLDELRQSNQKSQHDNTSLAARLETERLRVYTVLERLAQDRPDDVVVTSIIFEGGSVEVKGFSIDASNADELASRLAQSLKSTQWQVEPVQKQARQSAEDDRLWEFTLSLHPPGEERPKAADGGGEVSFSRLPEPGWQPAYKGGASR